MIAGSEHLPEVSIESAHVPGTVGPRCCGGDRRWISSEASEVTQLLHHVAAGDRSAVDRLFTAVYQELRNLAGQFFRREPEGNTLQPTALVHEAYVKMVDQAGASFGMATSFAGGRPATAADSGRPGDFLARRGGENGRSRETRLSDDYLLLAIPADHAAGPHQGLVKLTELDPARPNWSSCGSSPA